MPSRLSLTLALLVSSAIPSIGMAGVITDARVLFGCSHGTSISASLGSDATPQPDYPQQLNEHRETAGVSHVSVNLTSASSTAIRGLTVLLYKPVPPLESFYGFDEWRFIPDSPVFRIPRVPIV
jgi:hypothetical protein